MPWSGILAAPQAELRHRLIPLGTTAWRISMSNTP